METFLGQIIMFGGNFAPRGWAFCNGSLIAINQNQALFSLLGTTYGGDGRTTFALPDLRGRAPIHYGQGPGLSNRTLGEKSGVESNILNVNQLPSHNHLASGAVKASNVVATDSDPIGKYPANCIYPIDRSQNPPVKSYGATPSGTMASDSCNSYCW